MLHTRRRMLLKSNFIRFLSELLGTFLLVITGTGAIIINEEYNGILGNVGISLAFGLIIMAAILLLGKISGAQINPAVSIGLLLSGKLSGKEALYFIAGQLLGACLASFILWLIFPENQTLGATFPNAGTFNSFIIEFSITAMLMLIILRINIVFGANKFIFASIIGTTIGFLAFSAGPYTGASMNPARSIAPALFSDDPTWIWLYTLAPVSGACFGVLCFHFIFRKNEQTTK